MLRDPEAEVFEEGWNAGEKADTLDAALLGLTQDGLDEQAASSVSCDVWVDDDGAHLSEVIAAALRRARIRGTFFGILTFCGFGGVVAVLWQGGRQVLAGNLNRTGSSTIR